MTLEEKLDEIVSKSSWDLHYTRDDFKNDIKSLLKQQIDSDKASWLKYRESSNEHLMFQLITEVK